jgi:6,7-dimethyl-8-ribityllumazine synthase
MSSDIPALFTGTTPRGVTIGIVSTMWHGDTMKTMVDAARAVLKKHGVSTQRITHMIAPGAFEIPLIAKTLITKRRVNAVIALGVIVEGETHHANLIAQACTDGIMRVSIDTNTPIADGVLHVSSMRQAKARASRNGIICAETVLATLHAMR